MVLRGWVRGRLGRLNVGTLGRLNVWAFGRLELRLHVHVVSTMEHVNLLSQAVLDLQVQVMEALKTQEELRSKAEEETAALKEELRTKVVEEAADIGGASEYATPKQTFPSLFWKRSFLRS